jgi:mono/diheme cytochrome c family protein
MHLKSVFLVCLGLIWLAVAAGAAAAPEKPAQWQEGEAIYTEHCADCHRRTGQGLPKAIPALAANEFVTGDPQGVIQILLDGRQGSLGRMPAWGRLLTDQQLAAVATYIRQAWGNQAEAVTPEQVAKQRR